MTTLATYVAVVAGGGLNVGSRVVTVCCVRCVAAWQGDPTYEVTGVVTMEDIIEVILQTGIEDEFDHASSNDGDPDSDEDAITRRTTFDYAHVSRYSYEPPMV